MTDKELHEMWKPYEKDLKKEFKEVSWVSADVVARYITRKVTCITGGNTYSEDEELAVQKVEEILDEIFNQLGV